VFLALVECGAGAMLSGCGSESCGLANEPEALILTVSNASTGQPVCNARVTATGLDPNDNKNVTETLTASLPPDAGEACEYVTTCPGNDGGICHVDLQFFNSTLVVSAPGFETMSVSPPYQPYDPCSEQPPPNPVNVALTPN
jgi:hypothetical protein